jgi:EmrB/QacA subfamily drug resistance transporter
MLSLYRTGKITLVGHASRQDVAGRPLGSWSVVIRSAKESNYKVTFAALVIGAVAYALLQSMVLPVLPTIERNFHTSQHTVTWVLTAYLLSASVFTPILGRIGDMVGKERMLVATLVALSAGSLLAGLAHSIGVLIVARAIQGIGGGVLPLSFGIIRDEFPQERVAGTVGFIAAVIAVGGGLGIILAGPIVEHLGFHWLFWIPLAMSVVGIAMAQLFVPESPVRTEGGVSWFAGVLLSVWLVALLVAVSEAPTWGWGSTKTLVLFTVAVVALGAWVRVETRVRAPLIDMKMMRAPAVWINNLVAFLFGVGMYSAIAFLPEFLQTPRSAGYGFGASITQSGLFLIPMTATMFVGGLYTGRIAAGIGSKTAVVLGSIASCVSYLILAFAHDQSWEIYLASTLLGVGLGLAYSAMSALIVQAVPASQTGVASGMNANIRTIGGAIGAAVMASIVTSRLLGSGVPAESGYTRGFAFLAAITVVAIVAAMFIPRSGSLDAPAHHDPRLDHAELAMVAGGTITDV